MSILLKLNIIMVKKCCVPGCKSNYSSTRKENPRYVSVFGFPRNEELKHSWLKAICRTDYTPSNHTGVCEFHFDKNDILKYDKFIQPDGTIQPQLLRRPRLNENAVPKFIPHIGTNKTSHIKIEGIEIINQCHYVKEEVNNSELDALFPEDENCESQAKFDYVDIKNFIKEEIVDDSNKLMVQAENKELCCLSEQIDENGFSSTLKVKGTHQQEIGHKCNICDESFTEALDLRAHVEVHVRGFDFRCMVCGEDFIDEQACLVHVQERHSEEKLFSCPKCCETFSDETKWKNHVSTHQNESHFRDVSDVDSSIGKTHKRYRRSYTKSNQLYPCRVCGKTFSSKSSQQIHIRTHTGERPFTCSFCQKAFRDSGSLRKHERIHTGEKPYVCVACSKAFNQRVVLRNHIKSSHSAPDPKNSCSRTPYCCSVCTDMFATSQELIAHLIIHCDLDTVMKISSETGKRKYKSRTRLKSCGAEELD